MIVAFIGHLLAQVLHEFIVWGNENMTTAVSFFSDVPLRCFYCRFKADSNISKMHIFKAVHWVTISMVQCCINCSAHCTILHFFKEGNNKQSTFYRKYPQTTPAITESKSAYSRLMFLHKALPCQSVSNWDVGVMMWVLAIETDISLVCNPHPAGLWQSGPGFEPAAGSTLTFPQLGSRDVCGDQRLGGSE